MNSYRVANSYSFHHFYVAIFFFVLWNLGDVDVQLDTPTVALMCAARINILVHMCGDTLFGVQVTFFPACPLNSHCYEFTFHLGPVWILRIGKIWILFPFVSESKSAVIEFKFQVFLFGNTWNYKK